MLLNLKCLEHYQLVIKMETHIRFRDITMKVLLRLMLKDMKQTMPFSMVAFLKSILHNLI